MDILTVLHVDIFKNLKDIMDACPYIIYEIVDYISEYDTDSHFLKLIIHKINYKDGIAFLENTFTFNISEFNFHEIKQVSDKFLNFFETKKRFSLESSDLFDRHVSIHTFSYVNNKIVYTLNNIISMYFDCITGTTILHKLEKCIKLDYDLSSFYADKMAAKADEEEEARVGGI